MRPMEERNMNKKAILILLAPIPALLMGAFVMHRNGISPILYGQNILCYVVLGLFLFFLHKKGVQAPHSILATIALLLVACLLLACTFLQPGLEGVHRWLGIGNFNFYLSSIVLSGVIFGLSKLWQEKAEMVCVTILLIVMTMLFLQPDASQLSAFSAAIGFLVFTHGKSKALKFAVPFALIFCVAYAWMHIDGLEAVPHVEGILDLARGEGLVFYVLAIASLVILLIPFLHFPNASRKAKAIGMYYLAVIVSTFLGKFPVPVMGYGISPIIGYMLAIFLLMGESTNASDGSTKQSLG